MDTRPATLTRTNITSNLGSAMAEANSGPSPEEKSRYETLRSELIKALPKKRTADRSLVCW